MHGLAFILSEIHTYWNSLIKWGQTRLGPAEEEAKAELGLLLPTANMESHYGKEKSGSIGETSTLTGESHTDSTDVHISRRHSYDDEDVV